MRYSLLSILLIIGLGVAQPGYWGPGIWADFLQGKDTLGLWIHAGTDSATRHAADTVLLINGRSYSSIASGANSIAWGLSDTASGAQSVVAGGTANKASGDSSSVGGGAGNKATGSMTTIGGGSLNTVSGASSGVTAGIGNSVLGTTSVIAGGYFNAIQGGSYNVLAGGRANVTAGGLSYLAVGGGHGNNISAGNYGVISGGLNNIISASSAIIPGGVSNFDSAAYSFALGCSLRVPAADSFSGVIGHGAGAGLLVGSGKRTITLGVVSPNLVVWENDSVSVVAKLKVGTKLQIGNTVFDSIVYPAADTSTLKFWIGDHSFTITSD